MSRAIVTLLANALIAIDVEVSCPFDLSDQISARRWLVSTYPSITIEIDMGRLLDLRFAHRYSDPSLILLPLSS
jgi:hypothetical protein